MAYDDILEQLKSQGRGNDTELAHVTPGESMLLKALGGSGTINPNTGLREYRPDYEKQAIRDAYHSRPSLIAGYGGIGSASLNTPPNMPNMPGEQQFGPGSISGAIEDYIDDHWQERADTSPSPITSWDTYTDADPSDFADLSGEQLHDMSEVLTEMNIDEDDFYKYMPKYDERGEVNIRQSRAFERQAEARSRQDELLELAQSQYGQQSRSGFAATGNPMVDKQRQDIRTDIAASTEQAEWGMSQDIYDYQEDFQQKFGERLIAYEDRIEKKNANGDDDGSCFHPDSIVKLEDGTTKKVSEIQFGDKVEAMDDNGNIIYSKVVRDLFFNTKNNTSKFYYTVIKAGGKELKVTSRHRIFVNGINKTMKARYIYPTMEINIVKDGILKSVEVESIEHKLLTGKYDIFTESGSVVVDGVVCTIFDGPLPHKFSLFMWKLVNKFRWMYKPLFKFIYRPLYKLTTSEIR